MIESVVQWALIISYVLLAIAAVAAIVLPLINSLSEPKSLIKVGVGLVILIVLYFIGWMIAGDEVTSIYEAAEVGAGLSKMIGGILTMLYILLGISVVGIFYSEVSKAAK